MAQLQCGTRLLQLAGPPSWPGEGNERARPPGDYLNPASAATRTRVHYDSSNIPLLRRDSASTVHALARTSENSDSCTIPQPPAIPNDLSVLALPFSLLVHRFSPESSRMTSFCKGLYRPRSFVRACAQDRAFIVVTMSNEDEGLFTRTVQGATRNSARASGPKRVGQR